MAAMYMAIPLTGVSLKADHHSDNKNNHVNIKNNTNLKKR